MLSRAPLALNEQEGRNAQPAAPPVKVILITGAGRSGSTLLMRLIGEHPDCLSVGEVWSIWTRGVRDGKVCGCGRAVDQCPLWSKALRDVGVDPRALVQGAYGDSLKLHLTALSSPSAAARSSARHGELLMNAVRQAGASFVCDSSKVPGYARMLYRAPWAQVFPIHLVRDPRAVLNSHFRRLGALGARDRMLSAARISLFWVVRNVYHEVVARAHRTPMPRVTYESLVESVPLVQHETWARAGVGPGSAPSRRDDNHHPIGGHDVARTRGVDVVADEGWLSQLGKSERMIATVLTWPLLRRYGYPVVRSVRSASALA